MKLVLSRKGFDSSAGGMASPILPDGRFLSLPIPSGADNFTFADVNLPGVDLVGLLADLSQGQYSIGSTVHLDPDLDRIPANRLQGWRPALGQTGAAQTHLANENVGVGDVFLFFGWFRRVEHYAGAWRFVPRAPDMHILFGWLEVGAVLPIGSEELRTAAIEQFPWVIDHPHVANPAAYRDWNNTLYVAGEKSFIKREASSGGGRFELYSDSLCLTQPGESRSRWALPGWFIPDGRPPLTYHGQGKRWQRRGDQAILQTAGRGQEFVIDKVHYPQLLDWVSSIVRDNTRRPVQ